MKGQKSLPLWERGLKFPFVLPFYAINTVAPLVGAWIEIYSVISLYARGVLVAPLVGAWIEISYVSRKTIPVIVAPLVGAWIEICSSTPHIKA